MAEAQPSPLAAFRAACRRGELAYQVDADGRPVFHPRVGPYAWRVSAGLGTVYATTTVRRRGAAPHDVSLVDLDEGFRMMSRVEEIAPDEVRIGLRVRVRFASGAEEGAAPVPVFVPA
jgi:uncharacterized OB-fold protein